MNNTDIILESANLSEGDTIRIVCPVCRGGVSGERSLSITRDTEGIVWQCFRAKCGETGATRSGATFSKAPVKPARRVWEGVCHPLPDKVAETLERRWRITKPPNWWWTTDFGGRVSMSVRSPSDQHRGWVLRSLGSTARTKALTYINEDEEGLSWYKTQPGRATIIVEDIPSAVRASSYVNSVALLGTGISLKRALELAKYGSRPIVVALDQDATTLSFTWARKWSLLWGDVVVLPLTKDLKDMEENELEQQLQQWTQQQQEDEEHEREARNSLGDQES